MIRTWRTKLFAIAGLLLVWIPAFHMAKSDWETAFVLMGFAGLLLAIWAALMDRKDAVP